MCFSKWKSYHDCVDCSNSYGKTIEKTRLHFRRTRDAFLVLKKALQFSPTMLSFKLLRTAGTVTQQLQGPTKGFSTRTLLKGLCGSTRLCKKVNSKKFIFAFTPVKSRNVFQKNSDWNGLSEVAADTSSFLVKQSEEDRDSLELFCCAARNGHWHQTTGGGFFCWAIFDALKNLPLRDGNAHPTEKNLR